MSSARAALARAMTEADWSALVIGIARAHGWRVAHFRPARRADGQWRTPIEADGAGWPDLVLVRERVVFAELKAERGRLSAAQTEWRGRLLTAGAEHYVWTPRDEPEVWRVLAERDPPGRARVGGASAAARRRDPEHRDPEGASS